MSPLGRIVSAGLLGWLSLWFIGMSFWMTIAAFGAIFISDRGLTFDTFFFALLVAGFNYVTYRLVKKVWSLINGE